MLKYLSSFVLIISLVSCKDANVDSNSNLTVGLWRGQIVAQDNEIPFNFMVNKNQDKISIDLINGDETLAINDVKVSGDSIQFDFHIFDITVKAKIESNNILKGTYTKNYATDYTLPFIAWHDKEGRFDNVTSSNIFDGTWETTFISKEGKETPAIGIFKKEEGKLKGTFLTNSGDYRFLDGYTVQDTMHLFSFDGNHIYKFKAAKKTDSIIEGEFWSGKTGYKTFISKRNDNAKLADPNSLTFLKEGYDKIDFEFKDLNGNLVKLTDKKYQNKVVILQILGTWCPNCMDETKFYASWFEKNKNSDVEIIGLAYEVKSDFEYAKNRVSEMKKQLNVGYDLLIAGTTKNASETLPMLNKVMSYPTSIFIDKKGKVRKIHTGFSGPATGKYYTDYVEEFNDFMNQLMNE